MTAGLPAEGYKWSLAGSWRSVRWPLVGAKLHPDKHLHHPAAPRGTKRSRKAPQKPPPTAAVVAEILQIFGGDTTGYGRLFRSFLLIRTHNTAPPSEVAASAGAAANQFLHCTSWTGRGSGLPSMVSGLDLVGALAFVRHINKAENKIQLTRLN
uniref:HDC15117 n=1 Tax=Drosophila melanogaster TaxID=7227 RepID=Q6IJD3_DROME|nr:TPA_inf: HDC15117 [Drosophila melanogaster]